MDKVLVITTNGKTSLKNYPSHDQRAGYQMCVGCGRCDDICPEYISFSGCINKLGDAMQEVTHED